MDNVLKNTKFLTRVYNFSDFDWAACVFRADGSVGVMKLYFYKDILEATEEIETLEYKDPYTLNLADPSKGDRMKAERKLSERFCNY